MNKPKLFLHIGMNKNGSSSLQKFMVKNRDLLVDKGVLYPQSTCINNAHYLLSSSFGFGPNQINPITLDECINSIIKEADGKDVIISSEYLCLNLDNKLLIEIMSKHFELTVILYLRKHIEWINSLYNQAVKGTKNPPWEKGINSFIEHLVSPNSKQSLPYRELINKWDVSDVNLIIKAFEKEQFIDGDLITDFLSTIGIDSKGLDFDVKSVNKSIPRELIDTVDSINRAKFLNDEDKNKLIVKILQKKVKDKSINVIDNALAFEIRERFDEDVQFLNELNGKPFFKSPDKVYEDTVKLERFNLRLALKLMAELL